MIIKKHKEVYQAINSIWMELPEWLREREKECEGLPFSGAVEAALDDTKKWYSKHPFGSCENRSSHALAVFLDSLDMELRKIGAKGSHEFEPEAVRKSTEEFFVAREE
jgi:hypothetical protein